MESIAIGDTVRVTNKSWRFGEFYIGSIVEQWPVLTMNVFASDSGVSIPGFRFDLYKNLDDIEILSDEEAMIVKLEN